MLSIRNIYTVGALIKAFDKKGTDYVVNWEPDDPTRLQCLIFIDPRMVDLMKRYLEVLYLDMTHSANRFSLPFYQVNTLSSVGTNLSLFFGLVNKEVRHKHNIPDPRRYHHRRLH
ncbi:hypothetical protein QBC44DRAFT_370368 [Cladorrhinum sp. PSN332]|nr:hypothetical protein QBC44DRAFT_370368 [Cladorrhinum sp. PSN332]